MTDEKRVHVKKELISWCKVVVSAFVIALVINNVLVVNAVVPTASMENTIMTGERVFGSRLAYLTGEPERFDVVIFKFWEDDGTKENYVKRVIGLPGEKVEIKDGKVYIDDAQLPLRDDFVKKEPKWDYGPYYVPEGCYFMMGDNRSNSYDSRDWPDPYVEKKHIWGKVSAVYFPPSQARMLEVIE